MKMNSIRRFLAFSSLLSILTFYACSDKDEVTPGKGKVNFYLTDAPLDATNIKGVHITFLELEVNGPNGWQNISTFEKQTVNLLDFQSGLSTLLSSAELDTGNYTEVRLILDVAEEGKEKANEGCFLKFQDGTGVGMFVPSGQQTGYKLKGEFKVKGGKEVSVTLDFDVRKSVLSASSSGKYLLKPVVRMVVNNEVGTIMGSFPGSSLYEKLTVFAYRQGEYTSAETEESLYTPRFLNAVTSASVDASGNFKIAFLPPGTYDLYVAAFFSDGTLLDVIDSKLNVTVTAQQNTTASF